MIVRLYLIFVFTFLGMQSFTQTLVIAKHLGDRILVGADSKVGYYKKHPSLDTAVCKIFQVGSVVVTGSGVNVKNIVAILASRLRDTSMSFMQKLPELEAGIKDAMNLNYEIRDPSIPIEKLTEQPGTIIIACFEKDIPVLVSYRLIYDTTYKPKPIPFVSLTVFGKNDYLLSGHVSVTKNFIDSVFKRMSDTEAIEVLIKEQISITPATVGHPISLVELTPSKILWNKKGLCN